MGIESLTSAAAAAGFAMVSDDVVDESTHAYETSASGPADNAARQSTLPAIVDANTRNTQSIGARVTELLDAWRSKG